MVFLLTIAEIAVFIVVLCIVGVIDATRRRQAMCLMHKWRPWRTEPGIMQCTECGKTTPRIRYGLGWTGAKGQDWL